MTSIATTFPKPLHTVVESDWEVHSSLELIDELYTYNHWLFDTIRPFISGSVFEVGCGTGNITQFLLRQPRIVGIEPFGPSLATALQRFHQHTNVELYSSQLQDWPNHQAPERSFDSIVCLNVLEHIEDDVDALQRMQSLCTDDGHVIIIVPAHMAIYGAMDRAFAHFRRYNRKTLSSTFEKAGLRVRRAFYRNAIGFFGWLWYGRVLGRRQIPVGAARRFNRMVPFIDAMERLVPIPFGQSLVMVGSPRR